MLEADDDEEDLRPKALTKEQRIQQHTGRWRGAHHRLEAALEEIQASHEGQTLNSLKILKVKEAQLLQLKESLRETAALVDQIILEDPTQMAVWINAEDAKALVDHATVRACPTTSCPQES